MSLVLQILLCASVATITVFLVMLMVQARRTAASIERLAASAEQDLRRAADDVHEIRLRVEEITQLAKNTFELPSMVSLVVAGIVQGLPSLLGRRTPSNSFLETLLTGAQTALHLFRRRRAEPPKEAPHE